MNLFYSQKGNTTKVTQYILCKVNVETTYYDLLPTEEFQKKGEYTTNVCIAQSSNSISDIFITRVPKSTNDITYVCVFSDKK